MVEPKETLQGIAELYQVGPEAFGRHSPKQNIYPGQRLVFFDREIWAMCATPPGQAAPHRICLPGPPCVFCRGLVIRPKREGNNDLVEVHTQLRTPGKRKQTALHFLDSLDGKSCLGLYLPWKAVAPLDGRRYLKLIKYLRRRLKPPAMLWVELGPTVPSWKIWGGVDYAAVNQLADRVVLDLPPDPGLFERGRGTAGGTLFPVSTPGKFS